MDRFDDIWKNRFNEAESPREEWNNPDDMVWDAIALELPTKGRRRRWLIWFTLVLMVGFLIGWLFLRSTKDPLNSTSEGIGANSELFDHHTAQTQTPVGNTLAVAEVLEETKEENKASTSTKLNRADDFPSSEKQTPIINRPIREKEVFKPLPISLVNAVSMPQEERAATFLAPLLLPLAPLDALAPLLLTLPESEVLNLDLHPLEEKKKSRFELTFGKGLVYWQHRISDSYRSDLSPFDFNYTDNFGWQLHTRLEWRWNAYLTWNAGLQLEHLRAHSGHNSELVYEASQESAGLAANDYSLNLATPYGLAPADFQFRRTGDINTESVDLLVDFHSVHQIDNLSMPIGLQVRPLGDKGPWQPQLNFGLGLNYLIRLSNEIDAIDTHHSAIQHGGTNDFADPNIDRWHFDYRLGLGIHYKLLPELQLHLSYDWARGIDPIFNQGTYQTRIDRHLLSLGLRKRLGE